MLRNIGVALLVVACLSIFTIRHAWPTINGLQVATIRTSSMVPVLHPGDLIYIRPADRYHVGEVVSFVAPSGNIFTHRLVAEWTGDGHTGPFATKGDANNDRDSEFLSAKNIVGKAESRIPLVGFITPIFDLPPVMLFLTLIILAILFGPALLRQDPEPPAPPAEPQPRHRHATISVYPDGSGIYHRAINPSHSKKPGPTE